MNRDDPTNRNGRRFGDDTKPGEPVDAPPRSRGRRLAELSFPVTAIMAILILPLLFRGRLPDPMAIHWGFGGQPDGSGSWLADTLMFTALATLCVGLPFVGVKQATRTLARLLIGGAWATAAFLLVLRWVTLHANLAADNWTEAGPVGMGHLGVALVISMAAGAPGWMLAGDRLEQPVRRSAVAPAELQPGETVVWHATETTPAGNLVALVWAVGAVVAWLALPPPGRWIVVGSCALVVVLAALLMRVSATVGPSGFTARLGYLGWPRVRVPIGQVDGVSVEDVTPLAFGGWGYRVVPGTTAFVIRRGPGLRISRSGRSDLVVTLDGAQRAGEVLLAHLEVHRGNTGSASGEATSN